ncbi:MAG TPA: ATP-dependent sacrificial sulfur transferase LarE [Vicinamibacteria bacterium]|nr:ATP-dependent sacrificial sulfur transferase LarE [Vicinamibacteria bacterium]
MTLDTEREGRLDALLAQAGSLVVAYSGGVDSALLAVRAHRVLGARALAVTADSPSLPRSQKALAVEVASRFGLAHRVIDTHEVQDPAYARNDALRCYHCKTELFGRLRALAQAEGYAHLAYGLVTDDLSDFRPGHRAAVEHGVLGPLAEAGFDKAAVRALSRQMGLPTADLPASPCLSSRVPYGTEVTPEVLLRVERAEEAVRALGFRELRVRHLGAAARVEIAPAEMERLDEALRARIVEGVRAAGYGQVAIDPSGYRRGRLNEALRVLPAAVLARLDPA